MDRDARIVSSEKIPWEEQSFGSGFHLHRRKLAAAAGGRRLGCSMYRMKPGKRDFPYHAHLGNEEAIFVLAGEGTLRLDGKVHPIRAGDYVALPAGPDSAHQVVGTGDAELVFLCMSTMEAPDVSIYPDSDKVGVFAGAAPGTGPDSSAWTHRAFYPFASKVPYWTGEEEH